MERTDKSQARLNLLGRDSTAVALETFLAFLQGVFKDGYFGFNWSPDRNTTDLIIEESLGPQVSPERVEKLPLISVYEGQSNWGNMNAAAMMFGNYGSGSRDLLSPEIFRLTAQVISQDITQLKDITSTIFTMLMVFPSLIGKETGIAFPGSPVKAYGKAFGASGAEYPAGYVEMMCSVTAGLQVTREQGTILDHLLKNVTMTVRAAMPDRVVRQHRRYPGGFPEDAKDMTDLMITGSYRGQPLVDDPTEGVVQEEGSPEQTSELRED